MTHEREITEPVDLCRADGRLDPAAVGWTRHPLHRANLRGWGRTKRWEYWGITTPTHVVGLVVSSLDYAGVSGIYVLERATGREWTRDAVVPLARGVRLPERCGTGTTATDRGGVRIRIDAAPDGSTIRATAEGIEITLFVPLPPGHESMGVVVPWSERRFQLTVKDVARPVHGTIRLEGTAYDVDERESWAVLDHGRGRWPYRMTWNWAAGSGPDLGLQLGGRWTVGTGSTENALIVNGRVHKIGEELEWRYDRSDFLRPWRIRGPRVDVEFEPFHERVARTELLVVGSRTHQCFGHFSGWATTDEGDRIDVDGLVGWAEEARQRW